MARNRLMPCVWAMLMVLVACNAPLGLEAGAPIPPSDQPVELLPLSHLLAQAGGGVIDDGSAAALAARAARLRARAAEN